MLVAVSFVLALGAVLRSVQYFTWADLWHDELAVARNIVDRDVGGLLTRPLDHHQVAPMGFLAMVELSTWVFGHETAAFRLPSWIASLLSLLLFWRVASRFADGLPLVSVMVLFAISPALVYYGASVKPYGGDVTVGLFLVWLALRYRERPRDLARGVIAGTAGGAALLFSFPAVPTAAILGAMLLVDWRQRRPLPKAPLAWLGAGWAVGAALTSWCAASLVDRSTDEFMRDFWSEDFPPSEAGMATLWWALQKLYGVFSHFLVMMQPQGPLIVIVGILLALAIVALAIGRRRMPLACTLFLLSPLLAGLGAAFAGLLPFEHRLGLHSGWPTLVLAGMALCALRDGARGRWVVVPRVVAVVMTLPLLLIVLLAARPPYMSGGVSPRSVVEWLAGRVEPGDEIYVYTQGRHDMAFYGGRAGLTTWVQGERHYDEPRGYLEEVDLLRGHPRVWFFWVQLSRDEPALVRRYLTTIGREVCRYPEADFGRTGAVLYDLSDPNRLEAASARTFPIASIDGR